MTLIISFIFRSKNLEAEVRSKGHDKYVLYLNDSVKQISLNNQEFNQLLEQQATIYKSYSEFTDQQEKITKKKQLLQDLLAYNLNGKKINSSIKLEKSIVAHPRFEQATELIGELWHTLELLL